MMYARWSLNYLVSIGLIRRAALLAAFPLARAGILKSDPSHGTLAAHLDNATKMGLFRYLRLDEFVHHNTDGPANPYALVYDRRRVEQDFPSFRVTRTYKRFMHAPPLPVHRLPGETIMGWHLWIHLVPRDVSGNQLECSYGREIQRWRAVRPAAADGRVRPPCR